MLSSVKISARENYGAEVIEEKRRGTDELYDRQQAVPPKKNSG